MAFFVLLGQRCLAQLPSTAGVELYSKLEFISMPEKGKKSMATYRLFIYYDGDEVICKKPVTFLIMHGEPVKGTNIIRQTVQKEIIKYQYMVFKKGEKYGCLFDSIGVKEPKRKLVDSFERADLYKGFPFYTANDKLVKTNRNSAAGITEEIMQPLKQDDDTYPSSSHYYYKDDFKDIPYSFSEQLDKTHSGKLYKIRIVYDAQPKGKYAFVIPEYEYYFELRMAPAAPELTALLEKFKLFEAKQQ